MMINVSNLAKGNLVRYQGEVAKIEEMEHRTPGNLRAFYQVKMRNLRTGKIMENRFRPGESVERLNVETRSYQYLYDEGNHLVCMDVNTFEQTHIDKVLLGESVKYLKENVELIIAFEDGTMPISVDPPAHVALNVVYTEPGLAGDTATRTLKVAKVETGAEVKVPLFINIGDQIKVDTATGSYIERIK